MVLKCGGSVQKQIICKLKEFFILWGFKSLFIFWLRKHFKQLLNFCCNNCTSREYIWLMYLGVKHNNKHLSLRDIEPSSPYNRHYSVLSLRF